MFGLFESVVKAAAVVVTAPVAVVADVVKLPVTAYEGKDPFARTSGALGDFLKNVEDIGTPRK